MENTQIDNSNISVSKEEMEKKKYEDHEQSRDIQLTLFHLLEDSHQHYSNTIELYDLAPKYLPGRGYRGDQTKPREKLFSQNGVEYELAVTPAKIKGKDGKWKDYLPGEIEELVEDALRKIAANNKQKGVYLDNELGVIFTVGELRATLKKQKHAFTYAEIRKALEVCASSILIIQEKGDTRSRVKAPLFTSLGDVEPSNPNSKSFVIFNPLVTKSIKDGTNRLINHDKSMSLNGYLPRWLYKKLCQYYKQASRVDARCFYNIKYTTIENNSGIGPYKRPSQGIAKVEKSFENLIKYNILDGYKKDIIYSAQRSNKVVDALFILKPHSEFVRDTKFSNKRQRQATEAIEHMKGN